MLLLEDSLLDKLGAAQQDMSDKEVGDDIPVDASSFPLVEASELLDALSFMQKVGVDLLSTAPTLGCSDGGGYQRSIIQQAKDRAGRMGK